MNNHKNARLTHHSRQLMIERSRTEGLAAAAAQAGVSLRTAKKWRRRALISGQEGLLNRSSRPRRTRTKWTPELSAELERLRRARLGMRVIAQMLNVSIATVSRALARLGLSRIRDIDPPDPVIRYEHEKPGDLLHLDMKSLQKIATPGRRFTGDKGYRRGRPGKEIVHVAIDDHTRIAFVQILPKQTKADAVEFLRAAVAHYANLGVVIKRVITDNGGAYRSEMFKSACRELGIVPKYTRPYRPQTNGKAERFIQTCLREWVYKRIWSNSKERQDALPAFLNYYNYLRRHSALGYQPPVTRLPGNNVLQHHS